MRPNTLKRKLAAGQTTVGGWLAIPSSYSAEIVARQGYDCVNVDLQHGMIGVDAAVPMLQAVSATDATPLARVGKNEPAIIMKMLDAGAYGIICPMISTAADTESFVASCKYPPLGERSFGPARGLLYGGPDYFEHANDEILTLAMIETREGLENIDAILDVPGLDGLFIGPNDLGLALGKEPKPEPSDPEVVAAIDHIRERAAAAGKPTGIFCSSPEAATMRIKEGFRLVVPGHDASMLMRAAGTAVAHIRGN